MKKNKYLVEIDPDGIIDPFVILDEPDYDGPVSNINDKFGVYHVEASSIDEAIEIAKQEFNIDNI